jgi:hypothetical protein
MPEFIMLAWAWLGPLQYLTVTIALLLSIDLWKKFHPRSWNWVMLRTPFALELNKAQELAHNLLVALPQVLGSALVAALATGGDPKAAAFAAIAGAGAPLSHHVRKWLASLKKPPTDGGDQKPVGVVDRIYFANPRDPQDPGPPAAAIRSGWRNPAWRFVAVVALAIPLLGCGASGWQAQRDAANVVAQVTNDTVGPSVLSAYRASLLVVVRAQTYREDKQAVADLHKARWEPIFQALAGFRAAHAAWQAQIEAKGDPLPAALAARKSFCELRQLTAEWDVALPDFPGPGLSCGGAP